MSRTILDGIDKRILMEMQGDFDESSEPYARMAEGLGVTEDEVIRRIGRMRPNPAFMNNTCFTYLVEEAVPSGSRNQDPAEDISVELHPVGDIPHLIQSGRIDHGIVLNALQWWQLSRD